MENEIKINEDLKFGFEDLMGFVDFEEEFTLRDVIRACMDSTIPTEALCQIIQCPYLAKYWDEAEKNPFKDGGYIEYLEIYWWGSKHTFDGKRVDGSVWGFHGVGKEGQIPDDVREYSSDEEIAEMENSGFRQAYAVEFNPIYELSDYPIRISNKLHITNYDADVKNGEEFDKEVDTKPSITLIELLYWIFWELSFLGSPSDRDEKKDELKQTVKDLEEGKLKTIPWEEVKEHLKEKFDIEDSGIKEDLNDTGK